MDMTVARAHKLLDACLPIRVEQAGGQLAILGSHPIVGSR
jgi:hypothetical protein